MTCAHLPDEQIALSIEAGWFEYGFNVKWFSPCWGVSDQALLSVQCGLRPMGSATKHLQPGTCHMGPAAKGLLYQANIAFEKNLCASSRRTICSVNACGVI